MIYSENFYVECRTFYIFCRGVYSIMHNLHMKIRTATTHGWLPQLYRCHHILEFFFFGNNWRSQLFVQYYRGEVVGEVIRVGIKCTCKILSLLSWEYERSNFRLWIGLQCHSRTWISLNFEAAMVFPIEYWLDSGK